MVVQGGIFVILGCSYIDGIKICNGGMRWYNGVLCFKLEVLIDKRVVFGGIKLY